MTAPYPHAYEPNGWLTTDVDQTLPPLLAQLAGQYDVLILLSHLGIDADRYVAQHYPQINLIVGGHTHHLFRNGEWDNHTLLTAAEKYGHYIGEVTIELCHHHLQNMQAQTHLVADLPPVPHEAAQISAWQQQGQQMLANTPVAKLPHALSNNWQDTNSMVQVALKAIEWYGHSDAAILNNGLFLNSLNAGMITKADLHA